MPIWDPARNIEQPIASAPPEQESVYPESYWVCINDHKFWRGQMRQPNPSLCPLCDSSMLKWIPEGEQS